MVLTTLRAAVSELDGPPGRWGVAIPGPFDYASGVGRYAIHTKLQALDGVDLAAALGIAAVFLNDGDAFALGSWAAVPQDRVVGLCLGTGIGSGWVDRGRLVTSGPSVPPDGEVWLLDVDGVPLEDVVSRGAVLAGWLAAGGSPDDDVREVCAAARASDRRALAVLERAYTALGRTLTPWLDRFGTELLVVGGSVSQAWDVLGPFFSSTCRTPVGLSPDLERAALLGAAQHVLARSRT